MTSLTINANGGDSVSHATMDSLFATPDVTLTGTRGTNSYTLAAADALGTTAAPRRPAYLEMSWAFLGVWLLQLMTAHEVAAQGDDPSRISPAHARNVVR